MAIKFVRKTAREIPFYKVRTLDGDEIELVLSHDVPRGEDPDLRTYNNGKYQEDVDLGAVVNPRSFLHGLRRILDDLVDGEEMNTEECLVSISQALSSAYDYAHARNFG